MTSEQWRHIQELVERALAINGSDRRSWLDGACKDDQFLRREVESFLEACAPAQNFMETPAAASLHEGFEEAARGLEGQRIGAYRVLHEIGHGGMGTVYLAARADDQYQKRVAIKVIRTGMDSGAIVPRFRRERQILAALEHPNIARFFDGGTTDDGRPYLVMEYIEGQPIDSFCDSRKIDHRPTAEPVLHRLRIPVCSVNWRPPISASAICRDNLPSPILVIRRERCKAMLERLLFARTWCARIRRAFRTGWHLERSTG